LLDDDRVAVTSDGVPDNSILGYLVGLVHHRFTVAQDVLDRIMTEEGLPAEFWPNRPRPVPSFQAACRSLENPRFEEVVFRDPETMLDVSFTVEYMIDVLPDGSRQLTRKISYPENIGVSPEMRRLLDIYVETTQKEPEKMAKFMYDPGSDSIKRVNLYDNPYVLAIGELTDRKYAKVVERFNLIRNCYTESYLKHAWMNMLRNLGGVPWLKSCGSMWFAPKDAWPVVSSFGRVYNRVHNNHGTWRSIPVIDTVEHRNYLAQDIQLEYEDRFKVFLENIARKLESNLSEEKLRILVSENRDRFEENLRRTLVDRYNRLLGMSISAKVKDVQISFESSRLQKALEYLKNL